MGTITWNTNVNAPCCPGEIVGPPSKAGDVRQTILIQTAWDYPGTANSFGWSIKTVQKCAGCGKVITSYDATDDSPNRVCEECECTTDVCDHDSTDGTVDCKQCGLTATDFIGVAGDWLRDNDGATADDPGYFDAT